jgi:hypothetical protein
MTTHISKAFTKVFNKSFNDDLSFLRYFQHKGCYLDDLSLIPVNDMPGPERINTLINSVEGLAQRIKSYNPKAIVIVLKKIDTYAKRAIELAQVKCTVYTLPFPGNGHQNKFIEEFCPILNEYIREKT